MLVKYTISMSKLLLSRTASVLLGALSGRKFGQLVIRMRTHLEHKDLSTFSIPARFQLIKSLE